MLDNVPAAVLTVSTRCSRGERADESGPLAVRLLADLGCAVAPARVVPDGEEPVREALRAALADGARVVLTTGGTGVSPTDRTPEATGPLLERELTGVAEAVRRHGTAPGSVLSRGLVGTVGAAVVVNAPGSTGGVTDTVAVVGPLLGHILDQLDGGDH
ncbi:MogA/MoaB family molybdenum cofactor biosynthesis protein [Georgenia satyanarayanai]|uniref:MogA/MoaB family molybdenum cofactor biosynthesis protein n=1 Tax=Georgenia satyanarayanai TaxID=860221 RepID=UPI001265532B|nr:MogA/MoaB family molybdenum cofactor biosynthesis protein [Georgenia satyanarayanai]